MLWAASDSSTLARFSQLAGASEFITHMQKLDFGVTAEGSEIGIFVITNRNGLEAAIMDFGATLVSLKVPGRRGELEDVVLGYDNYEDYANDQAYFGGTIGRYANRIARGKYSHNGATYIPTKNDRGNHLHGGVIGFNKVPYKAFNFSVSVRMVKKATPAILKSLLSTPLPITTNCRLIIRQSRIKTRS